MFKINSDVIPLVKIELKFVKNDNSDSSCNFDKNVFIIIFAYKLIY